MSTSYEVPDGPKMLRETLCVAQAEISGSPWNEGRGDEHVARLQRLIDACDAHRPLGSDGRHGDLHTPTCGCEDVPPMATGSSRRAVRPMSSRLRQLVARAVSALPNQCDADATAWAAGVSMRRLPWFPQSPGCRVDSLHNGRCRCGRLGGGGEPEPIDEDEPRPTPRCDRTLSCFCLGQACYLAQDDQAHDACGDPTCEGDCEGEYNDGPAVPRG